MEPTRIRGVSAIAAGIGLASLLGCASGPAPIAFENRVFYNYGFGGNASDISAFEKAYPPLDATLRPELPNYIGVEVLGGRVRLSRPKNWVIRSASDKTGTRHIEYVSPNAYIFAVYERPDAAEDLWRDVMQRYEDDLKAVGAEVVGGRIPFATYNAQGRSYLVRRLVPAAKQPYISTSREVLLRTGSGVVLMQIVHQGGEVTGIFDEIKRTVETLQLH